MKIKYLGGTKFNVEERGHVITVDLPPEKGGTDQGMTPPELLAASFGTCIGVYVTQYCIIKGLNCDGMTVDMCYETMKEPLRISKLCAKIDIPAGVPDEHKDGIRHAAENCLIHQTLCSQPDIIIEFL